jgi:hypothetical protein
MKTSVLSAITAASSVLICVLIGTLLITYTKLKYRKKDTSFFDNYVGHKGQID